MPVKGNASSRTTSAIAPGTIDIRENPTQDISALSRNTENALNELGRIFEKKKIEEQQELAAAFGEQAFRLAHNMKDDGSGRKIAVHAIIGGIMSQITGAGFASGAVGAGLNEALIKNLKGKDPGTAQIVSAIIGAAAATVAGGSAAAGASAAASGTKWNLLSTPDYNEMQRRMKEAKTDEERKAIYEEYERKDKEQEEEEAAKIAEWTRAGIIPETRMVDFLNEDYSGYVSIKDGLPVYRTPSVTVSSSLHTIFDYAGYFGLIGTFAAGVDAALFYLEGDHEAAGWAAISAIPFMKFGKGLKEIKGFRGVSPFEKGVPSQVPKKTPNDLDIPQFGSHPKEVEKNLFPPGTTNKGFDSFTALKGYLEPAGENMQWHHIVEQSQIKSNRAGFSPEQIHNVGNVVALPSGKGSIHAKISSIYSSIQPFTGGKTVRDWLSTKTFEEQFEFGKRQLEKFGTMTLDHGRWVFKPFE
ncbi:hypothetical protein [Selenomonas noxia]|uniref:hypothetical protein n=1 Tax=Selenomonas noxia TaxID=135083 RepID=UPI0028804566|nr:hypothetical protein [Selenomonas noxia]